MNVQIQVQVQMQTAPRKMVAMMIMVLQLVCGKKMKMLMPKMAQTGCTDDTTKPGGPFPIYTNSRSSAPGGCYS